MQKTLYYFILFLLFNCFNLAQFTEVILTDDEINWIKENSMIMVLCAANSPPIEFLLNNKKTVIQLTKLYQGMFKLKRIK
jgi:hypothetical protein